MVRTLLLASAVTMAAPALAQTAAPAPQTTTSNPATTSAPATTVDQQATTGQAAPQAPLPAGSSTAQTTAAPTAGGAQPSTTVASQAEPSGDQVAQAVDSQFGTYDKDTDGKLTQTEFSAWMVTLKTASDPATKADSPDTKKWVGAAFAQADKDKSKTLDKTEVTGFLTQGQS